MELEAYQPRVVKSSIKEPAMLTRRKWMQGVGLAYLPNLQKGHLTHLTLDQGGTVPPNL